MLIDIDQGREGGLCLYSNSTNEKQTAIKGRPRGLQQILQAAGVLIEDFDFTPCQVSETLSDVLRQVDKRDPIVIPTYDDSKHSPNSSAQA
jgi:hypothetical protein